MLGLFVRNGLPALSDARSYVLVVVCAPTCQGATTIAPAIPLMKSRRRIAASRPNSDQLHQGFATGETGSNDQFALQKTGTAHVRFGSKAGIGACPRHVRFTPESGYRSARL